MFNVSGKDSLYQEPRQQEGGRRAIGLESSFGVDVLCG